MTEKKRLEDEVEQSQLETERAARLEREEAERKQKVAVELQCMKKQIADDSAEQLRIMLAEHKVDCRWG